MLGKRVGRTYVNLDQIGRVLAGRHSAKRARVNNFRNFAVWIVIALLLFALFSLFQGQAGRTKTTDVAYSYLKDKAASGEVLSITYSGDASVSQLIQAELTNKTTIQAYGPVTNPISRNSKPRASPSSSSRRRAIPSSPAR